MKKVILKRGLLLLALISLLSVNFDIVYSVYIEKFSGTSNLSVAVPIIRMVSVNNYNDVSDSEYINSTATHGYSVSNSQYCNEFKVVNYDESENITQVNLSYKLAIETDLTNTIWNFKLYKIEDDGTQKEVTLTQDLQTEESFEFSHSERQEDIFKIEISSNESANTAEQNMQIFVNLTAVQI